MDSTFTFTFEGPSRPGARHTTIRSEAATRGRPANRDLWTARARRPAKAGSRTKGAPACLRSRGHVAHVSLQLKCSTVRSSIWVCRRRARGLAVAALARREPRPAAPSQRRGSLGCLVAVTVRLLRRDYNARNTKKSDSRDVPSLRTFFCCVLGFNPPWAIPLPLVLEKIKAPL